MGDVGEDFLGLEGDLGGNEFEDAGVLFFAGEPGDDSDQLGDGLAFVAFHLGIQDFFPKMGVDAHDSGKDFEAMREACVRVGFGGFEEAIGFGSGEVFVAGEEGEGGEGGFVFVVGEFPHGLAGAGLDFGEGVFVVEEGEAKF